MNRTARHRHLLFFSTSLVIHTIFVVALVGVVVLVSDTPSTDSSRPLVVSLERGGGPGTPPDREEPPTRVTTPVKSPIRPETSSPKAEDTGESPSGVAGPGSPPGAPGITRNGGNVEATVLSDYIRSVRARIERHKRYPTTAARDNLEGTVTVSFLLDRRGTLLEKRVVTDSGSPALDEAALAAVADSSPFPPFPDGLDRETLLLRLPINYRVR
jgi:protein TonB